MLNVILIMSLRITCLVVLINGSLINPRSM